MKDEFYFPSKDGNTEIHTIEWKPEGQVKAVLQLSHGMVEYVDRYSEFAEYLCEKGFYVVGNDHLGHGKSVQSILQNRNQCLIYLYCRYLSRSACQILCHRSDSRSNL